jgi:hypothetical protein
VALQKLAPAAQLTAVQAYLRLLQYNHTGVNLFPVNKTRPLHELSAVAQTIIREALPIKCLEAVLVGLYLTAPCPHLARFPISFKSRYRGRSYRHIVLGIHHNGVFGAIGLSRRTVLMDKPLQYTLPALVAEYQASYAAVRHTLVRVRLGRPVPKDTGSSSPVTWRQLVVVLPQVNYRVGFFLLLL